MWCGDWGQLPQELLRFISSDTQSDLFLQEAKSALYTLGNSEDWDSQAVRVACLGPYLFGSHFFNKVCEVWARACGICYDQSRLQDASITDEVRETILVLDTLAYHVSFSLIVCSPRDVRPFAINRLAERYQAFLMDFDKEGSYPKAVALVEPSDFFKFYRKKLRTSLKESQILGCFMIALKASIAHCNGNLNPALTYTETDGSKSDKASPGNELKKAGNKKFKEGLYEEAWALYTEAIAKMRLNHFLYSNRAQCSLYLRKYREVELDARRVTVLNPNFEKGYYKLAQSFEGQNQLAHAKQVLQYWIKRCELLVIDITPEVAEVYKRLSDTANKTRNGKPEPKSTPCTSEKEKPKAHVPDLVSDSDSEEGNPTSEATNSISQATLIGKASEDLVTGLYKPAFEVYKQVLSTEPKMPEMQLVLLKYATGYAAFQLGSLEDLKEAVKWFLDITTNHKEVVFPLAYYGLSMANIKMNRFLDALPHIEKGLTILEKGICFNEAVLWPGTRTKIINAEKLKLQKELEEMQAQCRNPPKPDATCCYKGCPMQRSIYYSDPDFKGFQQVHCHSKCLVQYHPACWKEHRDAENLTEKGFLGQVCPTPDCLDLIVKLETIEKDGSVGRQFVPSGHEKDGSAKQKKTKKEKKQEQRELKKRQRKCDMANTKQTSSEREDDAVSLVSNGCDSVGSTFHEEMTAATVDPLKGTTKGTKGAGHELSGKTEAAKNDTTVPPPLYDAQYLLKREDEEEEVVTESRPKKWKKKRTKTVLTLDLEPSCYLYSEYQERIAKLAEYRNIIEEYGDWKNFCQKKKEMIPELDPDQPFFIPETLRNDPAALEAVLQHYGGFRGMEDPISETVYQYLHEVIEARGPMPVDGEELRMEVDDFPDLTKALIERTGGLRSFLTASMRFFIVDDMVHTYRTWATCANGGPTSTSYLPQGDDDQSYPDEDECEDEEEEELEDKEYGEEEEVEADSPARSMATLSIPNIDSSLNPSAQCFDLVTYPIETTPAGASLGGGDQEEHHQMLSMDIQKAFSEQRNEVSTMGPDKKTKGAESAGREVVVQRLLAGLSSKQLGESLVVAVNTFKGPLSPKMLAKINKKLDFCWLRNKPSTRDYFVQVNMLCPNEKKEISELEYLGLKLENERLKEKLESALDSNVQLQKKHTLDCSQNKEKMDEVNHQLQTTKQTLKKVKIEMETELKKWQQERLKLKEEIKLLKSSRNETDVKGTLDKTITELAKLRSENEDLQENCQAFEEASDCALERARVAEVQILETALKWAKERFERSTKPARKALLELENLRAISRDPAYRADIASRKEQSNNYIMEWNQAFNEFEKSVKRHIEKVENGEPLANLPVLNLPLLKDFATAASAAIPPAAIPPAAIPSFHMAAPSFMSPPPPQPLLQLLSRPHQPQGHIPDALRYVRLPLQHVSVPQHPPGHLAQPAPSTVFRFAATAPPGAPLLPHPKAKHVAGGPPPGLSYPGMSRASPADLAESGGADGLLTQAAIIGPQPTVSSLEPQAEAETPQLKSEKLFAKLQAKYPDKTWDELKLALQQVYTEKGFKGRKIAEIIKDTSELLDGDSQVDSPGPIPRKPLKGCLKLMRATADGSGTSTDAPEAQQRQQQKTWSTPLPTVDGISRNWSGKDTQCSICLDDLDNRLKQMRTSCGHNFHEQCLLKWYATDHTCPNCRTHSLSDADFPSLGK